MLDASLRTLKTILSVGAATLALSACGGDEEKSKDAAGSDKPSSSSSSSSASSSQNAAASPHDEHVHPSLWPQLDNPVKSDAAIEAEIDRILSTMTVEQKVGQVLQADIGAVTPEDVATYHLGSVLNGGNSAPNGDLRADPQAWLDLADAFWDASVGPDGTGIPAIWGTDAVHGHSNIVGATIFPHNIGLGAANDPDLIRRIGEVTALEIVVTGLDWTFAPTVATPRDDRWGRTYEGYAENGDIVGAYAGEMVKGLQGVVGTENWLGDGKVISTTKHFLGDGGTENGTDQGETIATEAQMRDIHAAGYISAIEAGVQSAMASYSSWHGRKMHGNRAFLNDVLVDQMGFDGFVVGDWNGHGQVKGCTPTDCPQSFNAGLDMYMAPDSWKGLYESLLSQVEDGTVSMERLDEAVSRILRVKLRAGIWDKGRPSSRAYAGEFDLLGSPEHRAVAREAVRKSLVLLKNDGTLPIPASANVLVTGSAANDMGVQTGGWTLSWQGDGNSREDFPNADTIFEGIEAAVSEAGGTATLSADGTYSERPDVAIVVFGEKPYAEFRGDRSNVDFDDDEGLNLLKSYEAEGIPVVAVFLSGRPMWVNPELNASNAFLAAWLPGSEGAGVADVIIGTADGDVRHDFTGRLSFTWPARPDQARINVGDEEYDPLFAYGAGFSYADDADLDPLPTDYTTAAAASDTLLNEGEAKGSWSIILGSEGGSDAPLTAPTGSTPDNAIRVSRTDRAAQEDTIVMRWSGEQRAWFVIGGTPVDWTRQSNGDMALQVDYRWDAAPDGEVRMGMACGADCDATYPVPAAPVGEWQTFAVRLSCFADLGVDLTSVSAPLIFTSDASNTLSVSFAGLVTSPGGTACPAALTPAVLSSVSAV